MKFTGSSLGGSGYDAWSFRVVEVPTGSEPDGGIRELAPPQNKASFAAYPLGTEFHGDFKRLEERCLFSKHHGGSLWARKVIAVPP